MVLDSLRTSDRVSLSQKEVQETVQLLPRRRLLLLLLILLALLVLRLLLLLPFSLPQNPLKSSSLACSSDTCADAAIPGSTLRTAEAASAFRQKLQCISSQGKWEMDHRPRLLPWPIEKWSYGQCDNRWRELTQGLFGDSADEVVRRKGTAEEWRVRQSAKYVWKVDSKKCGESPDLSGLDQLEAARHVLQQTGVIRRESKPPLDGSTPTERVILMVGDSMQQSFAAGLMDAFHVGLSEASASEEVVPLLKSSLPCHVPRMDHRSLCGGAHLLAKTLPGLKLVFVRNDYISTTPRYTCDSTRINFQVPWISTLESLVDGSYHFKEGGNLFASPKVVQEVVESEIKESTRGKKLLPPVVVLNRGMHFKADEEFFPELNDSMQAARKTCPHCLIIFRNTAAGHEGCKNAKQPLLAPSHNTNLPYNWSKITTQSRSPLLRKIVEGVGAVFLDIETMTSLRIDGHSEVNVKGKADCLHYCLPGPVNTWTHLLFYVLKELLPGGNHATRILTDWNL